MLIPVTTLPALLLPAMSVAAALITLWLAPSPEAETSAGQLAIPEPAVPSARAGSAQVKPTTTLGGRQDRWSGSSIPAGDGSHGLRARLGEGVGWRVGTAAQVGSTRLATTQPGSPGDVSHAEVTIRETAIAVGRSSDVLVLEDGTRRAGAEP